MVTVIIPSCSEVKGYERNGEAISPFRPAPLLETPDRLPQVVQLDGKLPGSGWSPTMWTVNDQLFTRQFQEASLGYFPQLEVHVISTEGKTIPIVDATNKQNRYAIGGRCEMLHNQYGIGSLIMFLLDRSPFWIMTPEEVEYDFMSLWYGRSEETWNHMHSNEFNNKSGLFPDWTLSIDKSWDHWNQFINDNNLPDRLPHRIGTIINSCMNISRPDHPYRPMPESCEIDRWPIAVCSWYGLELYRDKRTDAMVLGNHDYACGSDYRLQAVKDHPKDQGCGDDVSWVCLDDLLKRNQENFYATCMPETHGGHVTEEVISDFRPFVELLEYISHGKYTERDT